MHSATSLERSGLVRFVGPYAQTRVAMHPRRVVQSAAHLRGLLIMPLSLERSKR